MTRAQSEAMRRRWADPAYRARQTAANRVNGTRRLLARIAELERGHAELAQALAVAEEQRAALKRAWDKLCDCTDEFGADLGACAAYQDMLDEAIVAMIGERHAG